MTNWLHLLLLIACPLFLSANQVQIQEVYLLDGKTISLEVGWDHAWNLDQAPGNHDAVWLFAKIRPEGGAWEPLHFSNQSSDHTSEDPAVLAIEAAEDGLGCMLRKGDIGAGNVPLTRLELKLDQFLSDGSYDLDVFGIEMVWIPEGPFWLGDGASNSALCEGSSQMPLQVSSEAVLPAGSGVGQLDGVEDYPPAADLPAAWPKGYAGFYLMKYEIGQAQYRDFLNQLTYAQQAAHTEVAPDAEAGQLAIVAGSQNRNGIRIFSPGQAPNLPAVYACNLEADGSYNTDNDGQNRSCNYLNWADLSAYLDWAGLSPLSELEFEKACRGPETPVALGYAWGTDAIVDANTPLEDGSASEQVAEMPVAPAGLGSHGYSGPQGPLRAGFAAQAATTRLEAGASYYGVMELSGNLWELCVNVTADGLGFRGSNGDGRLDADGAADQVDWPGASGAGFRGGAWNSGILPGFRDLSVSDRFYAGLAPVLRRNTSGGRGVRR